MTDERAIAEAPLFEGHKLSAVGLLVRDSSDPACQRAVNLEAAAMATYHAFQLGDTSTVTPPEYMQWIRGLETAGKGYGKQ